MNILVTGHRGYVGSVLAPLLEQMGHSVAGVDADWFADCALYPCKPVPGLEKDIRDLRSVDLRGFEVVIHLAALSNDPLGDLDPELTFEINTGAALRLARQARDAGVRRFVATSSCSIYGAAGDAWIQEDSPAAPVTAYAQSKLDMEHGLGRLATATFQPVIARPGTVFGDSPKLRFDLVLNNLVAWAQATGAVNFKSDGSAWRPLLHVGDLCRALAALATDPDPSHPGVAGQAFNIGFSDSNLRVIELGSKIQSVLNDTRIEFESEASQDPRSYRVDCSRLASIWQPEPGPVSVEDGVAELARRLTTHPVAVEDFEGPRFQRVAHLAHRMATGRLDARLRRCAMDHA